MKVGTEFHITIMQSPLTNWTFMILPTMLIKHCNQDIFGDGTHTFIAFQWLIFQLLIDFKHTN